MRRDGRDYDFAGRLSGQPEQGNGKSRKGSQKAFKDLQKVEKIPGEQATPTEGGVLPLLRRGSLNGRSETTFAPTQNLNDMDIEYLDCFEEPNLVDYSLSTASSDTDVNRASPFYNRKVDYSLNLNLDPKQETHSGKKPKDSKTKHSTNPLVKLSNSLSRKSKSSYIYQKGKQRTSPEVQVIENHPPLTRKSILRRSVDSASSMETSANSDSSRSSCKKVHFYDSKKRKIKPSVELVELVKSDSETSLESRSAVSFVSLSEASLSSGTGSLNLVDYSLTSLSNEPDNFMGDQHAMGDANPSLVYRKEDLTLNITSPFTRLSRQYSSNDSDYSTESNESIYGLDNKAKPKTDVHHSSDESSTQTSAYSSSSSLKSKSAASPFSYSKTKVLTRPAPSSSSDEEKLPDIEVDDNTLSKTELRELPEDSTSEDDLTSNSNSTLAESSSDHEPEFITSPSGVKIVKEKFTSGSEFESSEESESGTRSNPTWLLTVKEHRASSPVTECPQSPFGEVDEKEIDFTLKTHAREKLFTDEGCQSERVEVEQIKIETGEGENSLDNTSHSLSSNLNSADKSQEQLLTHSSDTSIDPKNIESVVMKNSLSYPEAAPAEKWNSLKLGARRGSQGKAQLSSSSSDENESQRKYKSASRSRDGSPASHVSRRAAARNSPAGSTNSSLERRVQTGSLDRKDSPVGSKHSSLERKPSSSERKNSPAGSKNSSLDRDRKIVSLERKSSPAGTRRSSPLGSKNSSLERKVSLERNYSPSGSRNSSPVRSRNSSLERKISLERKSLPTGSRNSSPVGSGNSSLERKISLEHRNSPAGSKSSSLESRVKNSPPGSKVTSPTDDATHLKIIELTQAQEAYTNKILADLSVQSTSISVNYSSSFMPSEERASSLQATAGSDSAQNALRAEDHAGIVDAGDKQLKFKGYLDINGMNKDDQPLDSVKGSQTNLTTSMPRLAAAVSLPSSKVSEKQSNLRRRHKESRSVHYNKSHEAEVPSDEDNLNTLSGIGSIEDEKDLVYSIRLINTSGSDKGVEGDNEDEESFTTAMSDVKVDESTVCDQSSITATEGDDEFRKGGKWGEDYGCLRAMKWIMCPCADA